MNNDPHRILLIGHGHPGIIPGGGEIAAYNLYREFRQRDNCKPMFIGANVMRRSLHHPGTPFSVLNEDELLYNVQSSDTFKFSSTNIYQLTHNFSDVVRNFNPTVVHFHHYLHLGIEMIRIVRNISDKTGIVLTFHEYLGICNNRGQMRKTNGKLCYKSSPEECHFCQPEHTPEDYKMRELFIKSHLECVNRFISPSKFLIERYKQWGLPENRFTCIENGQPEHKNELIETGEQAADESNLPVRFAFFGQLNSFKGIDVLLEAFLSLPAPLLEQARLEIHGASLELQKKNFRRKILRLIHSSDNIKQAGPYDNENLKYLMKGIDWVMLPSIWWENSPMVIQEAFRYGRPVICSNIGGMAEKVADGINGLHFQVNSIHSLVEVMSRVIRDRSIHANLIKNISPPLTIRACADKHLDVYSSLKS